MLGGSIRRHPQELEKQPVTIKLPLESASTRLGYPTSSFGRNLLTSGTVFVHGLGVLVILRSPGLRKRNRCDSSPRDGEHVRVRRQAGLRQGGLLPLFRVLAVRSDIAGVLGRFSKGRSEEEREAGRSALLAATGGLRSPPDLKRTDEQEQPLLLRRTQLFETIFHLRCLALVPRNRVLEAQRL